jgi:hypothetical protein
VNPYAVLNQPANDSAALPEDKKDPRKTRSSYRWEFCQMKLQPRGPISHFEDSGVKLVKTSGER